MAYIPTIWESGDIVTSEKLNKLENGVKENSEDIENKILVVEIANGSTSDSWVTNKTAREIMNANFALFYILEGDTKSFFMYNYGFDGELYWVDVILPDTEISLSAENENEYLTYEPEPAPPLG